MRDWPMAVSLLDLKGAAAVLDHKGFEKAVSHSHDSH